MKLAIDLLKSFLEFLVILCKCKKLSNIKYFVSPCTTVSFVLILSIIVYWRGSIFSM